MLGPDEYLHPTPRENSEKSLKLNEYRRNFGGKFEMAIKKRFRFPNQF